MKIKKLMATLMAATMIMGTSVTTFAANVPSEADNMNVTNKILNVDKNATITAYQVIDAKYTKDGFVGYKWVAGSKAGQDVTFTKTENGASVVEGLTDEYITDLAANPEGLTTDDLESLDVGTWMLLVTGTNLDKVYNPMIISVYYRTDSSGIESGEVDANDNWSLATDGAYAKSSDIPVTKTVDDGDNLGENDQAAVGDTVTYTITSTIPSYSASSTATFVVRDEIVKGLEYKLGEDGKVDATVTLNKENIPADKYEVEMLEGNKGFTVTFDAEYLKSLAQSTTNRDLAITYEATVTEEAITEVGQNDVTIEYEHGSSTTTEYLYTVSFDGIAKKIGEDSDTVGLAGAEFTLYDTWNDANKDGKIVADELSGLEKKAVTSEENGYTVDFKGLDADKTYYLTETSAPKGYTINDEVYTITFANVSAAEDGDVTYDVLVNGKKVATVTYGQKLNAPVVTINNTKLSSLPSTGGIGTTIFTIGGCVIMIAAAGLFFANRRKDNK